MPFVSPPVTVTAYSRSNDQGRRGFALLITITLLAFLVLLLVSLASLTRVETQVASNSQQLSQARQNALMALNIALGQLQKTVGLDQRTTARADMASTTNVNGLTTLPNAGQKQWVSAWGNGLAASYATTPASIPVNSTTGSVTQPVLLNWLVSGNEATTFTGTNVVSSPSTPVYQPGSTISPTSLAGVTTSSVITINTSNGSSPAQLLVGPNTVNSANADNDYVIAPSIPINAPAGSVPGFTTAVQIGSYAYWVGDEGMKARINIRDNYIQQTTTAAQDAARFYSYVIAQRSGVEVTDRTNTPSLTDLVGTDYDPESALVPQILSPQQLPLTGTTTLAATNLGTASKYRYHDFTTTSSGVLADSYAGGLKKNLSAALVSGASTPSGSTPLFTATNTSDYGLPTWDTLRNYAQTTMTGGATISTAQQSTLKLYPVITYAAIGVSVSRTSSTPSQLAFNIFPVIGLWNPYNFSLPTGTYEVGFGIRNGGKITVLVDGNERAVLDLGSTLANASPAAAGSPAYFRFSITTGSIGAGGTPIFRINGTSAYSNTTPITLSNTNISNQSLPGYASIPWSTTPASLSASEIASSMMEIRNVFSSGSYLEAALTSPNALAGVSNFKPLSTWYQAIQNVGFLAPGSTAPSGYSAPASATVKLAAVSSYPTSPLPSLPYVDIRIQAAFEGHHSNVYSQIGFPVASNSNQWFRWVANANLRAPISTRTTVEENWMATTYPGNISYGGIILNDGSASNLSNLFNVNLGATSTSSYNNISSGLGHDIGTKSSAKMFALLPAEIPLMSIGELQHAPLSAIDAYPAYALGNSLADYRLARTATQASILRNPLTGNIENYYDISWHLNRSLLDQYFVSSALSTLTQGQIDAKTPLPNARLVYQTGSTGASPTLAQINGASAYDQAAANLMVAGSFNINSTSSQAWQAFITGNNNLKPTSSATPLNVDIPRSPAGSSNYPTYSNPSTIGNSYKYQGNRELAIQDNNNVGETSAQKAARAADIAHAFSQNIVAEIKKRGPFISLGDFFNRRLISNDTGLKGTLQAAIDETKPPAGSTRTGTATGPYGTPQQWISVNPSITNTSIANSGSYSGSISQLPVGSTSVYDLDAVRGSTTAPAANDTAPQQSTGANSVKFITQADLLSLLGPALSARSDTFVIRTYGDVKNPTTGIVTGRAWCEAVVQRLPGYVDTVSTPNPWSTASGGINPTFGRRLKVVSFRWLSSNDI